MSISDRSAIMTDLEFSQSIGSITEALTRRRTAGYFQSFDHKRLYYEYFLLDRDAPSVVIVHGLSEFTKKYYELTHYFLSRGYQVFLYDQRCHGFSERLTDERDLLHVADFQDYVRDLDTFIETVVRPVSQGPLSIFSHSMGGAVTALYLQDHPQTVQKAVLSAPMFQPIVGNIPYCVAKAGLWLRSLTARPESKFNPAQRFNPEEAARNTDDPSRNRYLHNLQLRVHEPMYQTTPLSLGWIRNSLQLTGLLERKKTAQALRTPLLLLSAEQDQVVNNRWHRRFADKCPVCQLEIIPRSGHTMFNGDDEAVRQYVGAILTFLDA